MRTMNKYFLENADKDRLKPAICALIQRDGKILMIKRAKEDRGAGFWTPVTGSVEAGESILDAVKREVREEVRLEIAPVKEIWQCPTMNNEFLLYWWLVSWVSGNVVPEPSEVEEFRWLSIEEILQLTPLFEDTVYFFEKIWSQNDILL